MHSIWKPLVLVFLFSLLIITSSCSYSQDSSQLTNQYNDLVQKYNGLLQTNSDLTHKYNDLVQQNTSLSQQNNALLQQNSDYRAAIEKLSNEVKKIFEELQNKLEGAIVPPYITMNGRKTTYTFRNLDNKVETWSFDVETLESNTVTGTFMRNLDISQLNQLGLGNIAQKFINGTKYVKLGGKFTVLDFRPYVVKENFQSLASTIYSGHTDDESRIKEVWNMVTQLCPYTGELKETPRLPLETLLFGGGDCEDVAILTASILKAMSPNWDVELVYMDSDNPTTYKSINHVSVFVDTGTYKTFVESTQKNDMSPYKSVDGFYLKVP